MHNVMSEEKANQEKRADRAIGVAAERGKMGELRVEAGTMTRTKQTQAEKEKERSRGGDPHEGTKRSRKGSRGAGGIARIKPRGYVT